MSKKNIPQDTEVIAKAIRVEYDSVENKLFIVFEVIGEKTRQEVLKTWASDIEYKLIGKNLVKHKKE